MQSHIKGGRMKKAKMVLTVLVAVFSNQWQILLNLWLYEWD